MELNLNLNIDNKTNVNTEKAIKKEKEKAYQPSFYEIWEIGYKVGKTEKKGIFQLKNSEADKKKLLEVREAIERKEIETGLDDLKKLNKSYALNVLYLKLVEIRRTRTIKELLDNFPENYFLINREEDFEGMLEVIKKEEILGLDTETTGLDPFGSDKIVGISISASEADKHYYIPIRHNVSDKQLKDFYVLEKLKPILESEKIVKVLHNAKFDAHMLKREDIELKGILMDTMLSFSILNENEESYSLKKIAEKYKNYLKIERADTFEELFGKGGFENIPLDIGTYYAAKDTELTLKLYKFIKKYLDKNEGLNYISKLETETLKAVIKMERDGFLLDTDFTKQYAAELEIEVETLKEEIKKSLGNININSNQQLSQKLYNELKLPDKSKKRNRSVDANALKALKKEHVVIEKILEYREKEKLLNTYIKPLPEKISRRDGKLHGSLNQLGAKTGRFSSNNPNLQNLPSKARKMVIAEPGHLLVGIDFSKVEPSILADVTRDVDFLKPFTDGLDIYSALAAKTFNKKIEECGDGTPERKKMKTGLLAVMYGTSPYTLAEQLEITQDEAEQFIQDFLNNYHKVAEFIENTHLQADVFGFVETKFGRKRRFPGHMEIAKKFKDIEEKIERKIGRKIKNIWGENVTRELKQEYWKYAKEYNRVTRQSVNAIIQGTAADIMKMAIVKVDELFEQYNKKDINRQFNILATIHDELLIQVPGDITIVEVEEIENSLKNCVSLNLPLNVDTEIMEIWGEGISKKEYFKRGGI